MPRKANPQIDTTIVQRLAAAKGAFVSGEELAGAVAASRVTVLNRIRGLRDRGYRIESRHRSGHRLTAFPETLDPTAVAAGTGEGLCIHFSDILDSTNREAERLLVDGSPTPFAVIARTQTGGRGRRGRVWISDSPANLYLSLAFRPGFPPSALACFTLWMGIRAAAALEAYAGSPLLVKWPNDIQSGDAKLAGILTEGRIEAEKVHHLILGIGVNSNITGSSLPLEPGRRAVSLRDLAGSPVPLNEVASALANALASAYATFATGTYETAFAEEWPQRDLLRGKPIAVISGNRTYRGTAEGISPSGDLLVKDATGTLHSVPSGDATIERQPPRSE